MPAETFGNNPRNPGSNECGDHPRAGQGCEHFRLKLRGVDDGDNRIDRHHDGAPTESLEHARDQEDRHCRSDNSEYQTSHKYQTGPPQCSHRSPGISQHSASNHGENGRCRRRGERQRICGSPWCSQTCGNGGHDGHDCRLVKRSDGNERYQPNRKSTIFR